MPDASVVLVEDSAPYARLVSIILADALPGDTEVRHHERLGEAIADLRARGADCVVLDLGLPDAEGLEGLARMRRAGVTVPVVVLSGHDDDRLAVEAIRAGAQDYLIKGQERDPARFVRAIRFAIERRRAQERGEDVLRAREDRWRVLANLAPVGIVELAPDGGCLFTNDRAAAMLGRPREQLLGQGWRTGLHPEDARPLAVAWTAAGAGDGEVALEVRFVTPAGEVLWTHLSAVLLRDPGGVAAGWLGTLLDVTTTRRAREELHAAERELRRQRDDVLSLTALAREASVADDPVPLLCDGARAVLGAEAVELLEPGAVADGMLEPVVIGTEQVGTLRIGFAPHDAPPDHRAGTIAGLLAAELGAAVQRRRLLSSLRDLARTDPLTELANRRMWDERLTVELARAGRYERPLCIAALDLDQFKSDNDRHGHQAGDLLLREAAVRWQGALRGSDLLARLGGDEFALLLPDCDTQLAGGIVERLRGLTPGADDAVGCSAGIALWEPGEDPETLLARADTALYAAKAAGRGRSGVA